jgi:hypothetical protein
MMVGGGVFGAGGHGMMGCTRSAAVLPQLCGVTGVWPCLGWPADWSVGRLVVCCSGDQLQRDGAGAA